MRAEFDDKIADAGIHRDHMPWDDCIDIARRAQAKIAARRSHAPLVPQQQRPPQHPGAPLSSLEQGGSTAENGSPIPRYVYPGQDAEWVRTHQSDLVAYRICSRFLKQGHCDAPDCHFKHQLPEKIDINGEEWKAAAARGAEYRAKYREKRAQEQAAAVQAPVVAAVGQINVPAVPTPSCSGSAAVRVIS